MPMYSFHFERMLIDSLGVDYKVEMLDNKDF